MTKVLLVDDDHDCVDTLVQLLEIEGIEVVGKGYNGREAFELYKQLKPDVIILDMKMPEYDGKYAIDHIKKEDPDAKIIVITGYTEYDNLDHEVAWYFHKPYEVDSLIEALRVISEQKVTI